ncbi:unnamed protein product [Eruca vesicaria subsp. sativa]|uniref:Pentatricopeptide repeat-containing protein n=1 Tax=Eruca vesicaria subsp. sativa TaxID=29727 RepID=A0ABC8K1T5_ERUVS|nr:unnamed protein product [Eruca vesicaria subsp. sativa]
MVLIARKQDAEKLILFNSLLHAIPLAKLLCPYLLYDQTSYRVDAYKVFDEMPERKSVTWNVMITGLTNLGEFEKALCLLEKMLNRTVVSWTTLIDG